MNDIVQVGNPFGGSDVVRPSNNIGAVANSDQQRAMAEVQAMVVVARQAPRNQKAAADRILIECQRPRLAEGAIYSFPRGGTAVTGPSIRLARSLARNWGNVSFGMREMEQLPGVTLMKAFAWDLETNVREERDFHVPHEIQLKGGQIKKLTDPRDIYEIAANMGARRTRACILSLIPEDVVEMALDQCEETLRADCECTPETIQRMLSLFAKFGVVQQQIEARLQRRIDTIQPALMVGLRKIYNSLSDGMTQPEQWFEPIEAAGDAGQSKPTSGNAAAKEALKKTAPKKAAKAEPAADVSQAQGSGEPTQTMGEKLGDEIPKFDGTDGAAADEPQPEVSADYVGPKPDTAERNQTWYNPAEDKLRYAHITPSGVKWYLEPQPDDHAPAATEPETDIGISLYRVIADKIADAGDLATLSEVQEFFGESKPKLTEEEIGILRNSLAERRNELS